MRYRKVENKVFHASRRACVRVLFKEAKRLESSDRGCDRISVLTEHCGPMKAVYVGACEMEHFRVPDNSKTESVSGEDVFAKQSALVGDNMFCKRQPYSAEHGRKCTFFFFGGTALIDL